jgi:hypothetical protein
VATLVKGRSEAQGTVLLKLPAPADVGASATGPAGTIAVYVMVGSALEDQKAETGSTAPPDTAMHSSARLMLTRRQKDILREAAHGRTNAEIA